MTPRKIAKYDKALSMTEYQERGKTLCRTPSISDQSLSPSNDLQENERNRGDIVNINNITPERFAATINGSIIHGSNSAASSSTIAS
jgi:hypothetical protein